MVSVPLYNLEWHEIFSELVSVVRALGLWLLDIFLSPSDVVQVPDALPWRVVTFSAVVVLVFPPSEFAQEGAMVLGAWPC